MKEFSCMKCRRYKKMELFSHKEKGYRSVCIPCAERIKKAMDERIAEHSKSN